MLNAIRHRGGDLRRLRLTLALLFFALAIPTGILVGQAYRQLKWESFFQYRSRAEDLVGQIDQRLVAMVATLDNLPFNAFTFLEAGADRASGYPQRSVLSAYPVEAALPGVIGFFQVDARGTFSTPLLPQPGLDPAGFGIGPQELAARQQLAGMIRTVLADNRLVPTRHPSAPAPVITASRVATTPEEEAGETYAESPAQAEPYRQEVFDELNAAGRKPQAVSPAGAPAERDALLGKLADLNLDSTLEQKSRDVSAETSGAAQAVDIGEAPPAAREMRTAQGARIDAFERDVDPFEFSMLASGHLVLYRKVWLEGQRYIQGLLVDRDRFLRGAVESPFLATGLSGMSELVASIQNDVIGIARGDAGERYDVAPDDLRGTVLYRSALSAPLQELELIIAANRLPPGPGATVLTWVTVVIVAAFLSGFLGLYRLGVSQIRLTRQQQDFIAAVSHELKTPLTSIRMYGEILREGWVDESKRQQYYDYIHGESERLGRLISNVLRLSRIDRDELQLDLKPIQVSALLDQVQSRISSQVERAGFSLDIQLEPAAGRAWVSVDADALLQIVINLVDNALKFSSRADDRRISINSNLAEDDRVVIGVRDRGPGVQRDQARKIFQPFYRGTNEAARDTAGTGIGLAIVEQLTAAMGGHVEVAAAHPGSAFLVSFPVARGDGDSKRA